MHGRGGGSSGADIKGFVSSMKVRYLSLDYLQLKRNPDITKEPRKARPTVYFDFILFISKFFSVPFRPSLFECKKERKNVVPQATTYIVSEGSYM